MEAQKVESEQQEQQRQINGCENVDGEQKEGVTVVKGGATTTTTDNNKVTVVPGGGENDGGVDTANPSESLGDDKLRNTTNTKTETPDEPVDGSLQQQKQNQHQFNRLASMETYMSQKTQQSDLTHQSVAKKTTGGAGDEGAVAPPTKKVVYERVTSFESRDTRDSIGWLANVVDDGLKDKDPRDYGNSIMTVDDGVDQHNNSNGNDPTTTAAATAVVAARDERVGNEKKDASRGDGGGDGIQGQEGQGTQAQGKGFDESGIMHTTPTRKQPSVLSAQDDTMHAHASGGVRATTTATNNNSLSQSGGKMKKKRKRSITLDAAIDAQNHKNILMKNKSYEYAKLAHNKFNMLYEKNENFFDVVGRRIPIVIDAWRSHNNGSSPSSLIQCWANEYCARDTPGPWSAATEPTLRTDIYQYKYTVEISEFKEEEEERLKMFRELSSRHIMKLSENYKSGFSNAIPGRVYMKNCAEWTPNCQLYTKSEFMRKEDAIRCGIGYILALPIHESGKHHQPVCVLEIARLGTDHKSTNPANKLFSAMAHSSILQDVQFLNENLKRLGLVAPVVPQDLFGYGFDKLCPQPKSSLETIEGGGEGGGDDSIAIGHSLSHALPSCPLTASVMRPDEKDVMANIVKKAVENGDVEYAQFWYHVTKRKGSLVTNGMPFEMNEYHDESEPSQELPWYVKEQSVRQAVDLGLQPFSRLTAYRIACEERALSPLTGGPVGAAYNAFKTTSKAKIIYWPDVQNATSSKFVMSHVCASLKVEAVAAVVIPNLLLDTNKQRATGDTPSGNVILELVLPSSRTREQHRKSISNVVNMASCEGKQLQLSWKQRQLEEQQNALAQLKKHLNENQ